MYFPNLIIVVETMSRVFSITKELWKIQKALPGLAFVSGEQSVILKLMDAYETDNPVTVKYLESVYPGSRSAFQLFLRRLEDKKVIKLSTSPQDRRCRLVELDGKTAESLSLCRAANAAKSVSSIDLVGQPLYNKILSVSSGDMDINEAENIGVIFSDLLKQWMSLRKLKPLPYFEKSAWEHLQAIGKMGNFHIVDFVNVIDPDFQFIHIGDIGKPEADLMHTGFLSTLKNDHYRESVWSDYMEVYKTKTPSIRSVNVSTNKGEFQYWRLILPFISYDTNNIRLVSYIELQSS